MSDLAHRLKRLRSMARISARTLGMLAKTSPTYPALIESGARKRIGGPILSRFAKVLGTTTDYLMDGLGRSPTKQEILTALQTAAEALLGAKSQPWLRSRLADPRRLQGRSEGSGGEPHDPESNNS